MGSVDVSANPFFVDTMIRVLQQGHNKTMKSFGLRKKKQLKILARTIAHWKYCTMEVIPVNCETFRYF